MKILITGATGFVGRQLTQELTRKGHSIVALTRAHVAAPFHWDPERELAPAAAFEGVEAVVHLAGEPVAPQRWSTERKKRILESRRLGTRNLVQTMNSLGASRPRVLVAASAIGFYGNRGEETLTETSTAGEGFLSEVCQAWETETFRHSGAGTRTVAIRIGLVLGKGGGALEKLSPLYRLGLGGPIGTGRQWVSWIHLADLIGLLEFALLNPEVSGVLNGVAPGPVRNAEFARSLGSAVSRPAILKAPAIALKLALGELSSTVLDGQRVLPRRAQELGYDFRFAEVAAALRDATR